MSAPVLLPPTSSESLIATRATRYGCGRRTPGCSREYARDGSRSRLRAASWPPRASARRPDASSQCAHVWNRLFRRLDEFPDLLDRLTRLMDELEQDWSLLPPERRAPSSRSAIVNLPPRPTAGANLSSLRRRCHHCQRGRFRRERSFPFPESQICSCLAWFHLGWRRQLRLFRKSEVFS